ncbi:hypothetical protein lerEdw1_008598 [Lerista edwardsae]|nr:hypothetical protein lerEdw1_008598 [Lerista edwardsae]
MYRVDSALAVVRHPAKFPERASSCLISHLCIVCACVPSLFRLGNCGSRCRKINHQCKSPNHRRQEG